MWSDFSSIDEPETEVLRWLAPFPVKLKIDYNNLQQSYYVYMYYYVLKNQDNKTYSILIDSYFKTLFMKTKCEETCSLCESVLSPISNRWCRCNIRKQCRGPGRARKRYTLLPEPPIAFISL